MRAQFISENINFEKTDDPYKSLRIGQGRLIKKGETFIVYYKGEPMDVVALEDEEDTGQANYLDFMDSDGGIMWAIKDKVRDREFWYVPEIDES